MTTLRFIPALLLIVLCSCEQNTAKKKVDPNVTLLSNRIIPLVNYIDNPDSCKQALLYLDSATSLDSNCFLCYYDKLMFLYALKQFDKAVETVNACIRIKPTAYGLYLTGGLLYEKIGDTISSRGYFQQSLKIINSVLDTMKVQNMDYERVVSDKAINLIMLDDNKQAKELLQAIADRQQEPELKERTLSFMNKSKKELVEMMTNGQNRR